MSLHLFDLQKAIFSALDNGSLVDASGSAITGVFDHVPADSATPFVVVGYTTQSNISTKTSDLHDHTVTIHVWSEYRGFKEVKSLMEQIYAILHDNAITITGATLINLKQEFSEVFLENDGITRHGVMRFRATIAD